MNDSHTPPQKLKSCGIICFREHDGHHQFLLMRHPERWDLPKGHVEDGETELQTALRETHEETGFSPEQITLDEQFRWETHYETRYTWLKNAPVHKTVVIFLGWVADDAELTLTEHQDAQWLTWSPPHDIQAETINPLLEAVAQFFAKDTS